MTFRMWLCLCLVAVSAVPAWALQDPTRPPGIDARPAQATPLRSLSLSSIVYSADRRVAVIDGEPLREGQEANGVRVRKIYRDRVDVVDRGRVRVLRLEMPPVVRRTQ